MSRFSCCSAKLEHTGEVDRGQKSGSAVHEASVVVLLLVLGMLTLQELELFVMVTITTTESASS